MPGALVIVGPNAVKDKTSTLLILRTLPKLRLTFSVISNAPVACVQVILLSVLPLIVIPAPLA